jgi:hypothetical protein
VTKKQFILLVVILCLSVLVCFTVLFPAIDKYWKASSKTKDESALQETGSKVAKTTERQPLMMVNLSSDYWKTKPPAPVANEVSKAATKPAKTAAVRTAAKRTPAKSSEAERVLELQDWSWFQDNKYAVVEGYVKNISDKSLGSVQVVVWFEDEDGRIISSQHSLIEYNPILPGQTSPFFLITDFNPRMKTATIDFRGFSGETLPWRNAQEETSEEKEESEPEEPVISESSQK